MSIHLKWMTLAFSVGLVFACGDDTESNSADSGVDMSEDTNIERCQTSEDCSDPIDVCRGSRCVEGPLCDDIEDCETGENCLDNFCTFDPEICLSDSDCEESEICETGGCRDGCRNNAACDDTEFCDDELSCQRLPCTELPCDDGYDCIADTGECLLRACDGGCEAPLQCRIEDDRCVECFEHEECGLGEACSEDGECAALECTEHDECPEGAFCINERCLLPPECEDDLSEPNDDWQAPQAISEGITTGLVSCPYNEDYFSVVADGDHSLNVEIRFTHEVGNIDLEVLNPVGVTFAERISTDDNESLTANIFSTGAYTIHVYQEVGTQATPYEIEVSVGAEVEVAPDVCLVDGFEPNDTSEDATEIYTGRWTGPSICEDDEDFYWIHAEAGELLRVCLTPSELFTVDLGLEIQTTEGTVILEDFGRTMFCVEEDLLESDDYRARVFPINEGATAAYHIEFDVRPGCRLFDDSYDQDGLNDRVPRDEDPPLEVLAPGDTPIDLMICPRDSDYWPIVDLHRRDRLEASIDFEHDDGNLQLQLLRPTGTTLLASVTATDQESIDHLAELDGTHFLRIYGEGDAQGPYSFTYAQTPYCTADSFEDAGNDTEETAADFGVAGSRDDLSVCDGDDDWFTFVIPNDTGAIGILVAVEADASGDSLDFTVAAPDVELPVAASVLAGEVQEISFAGAPLLDGDENAYLIHVSADGQDQNFYSLFVTVSTE